MEKIYESVAGMDVHLKTVVVCIIHAKIDCREITILEETFGTESYELRRLNDWVNEQKVECIVMESTGQYWRPVWNILEGDFNKILAHPLEVKVLKGRKTDKKDAKHMADMVLRGVVRGSYVPDTDVQEARLLQRTKANKRKELTRTKNQIHNILQIGNIKLSSHLTDIFGVTGRSFLDLLVNGEVITIERIEELRKANIKASSEQILASLDGKLSDVQRKLLGEHFEQMNSIQKMIDRLDELLVETYISKHQEVFERLLEIPGVGDNAAKVFLTEVGWNVDAFPTAKHLSRWAGLVPGENQSAEVQKKSKCAIGNKRLKGALCLAAQSASSLGGRFRAKFHNVRCRAGKATAYVAVAHELLVVMYTMVKKGVRYDKDIKKNISAKDFGT